jgi:putative addiction module killer protein
LPSYSVGLIDSLRNDCHAWPFSFGLDWQMTRDIDKFSNVPYKRQGVDILQTHVFRDWLDGLRDRKARLRIDDRLKRLASGNLGDTKPVSDGIQELRIWYGPGYRIYYIWRGEVLILLLNGGNKDSQRRDVALAKRLAKEADDGIEIDPL